MMVFISLMAVSFTLLSQFNKYWLSHALEDARFIAILKGNDIRKQVQLAFSAADTLGNLVRTNQGDVSNFKSYAKPLLQSVPMITNLQLAPDGILSHIYPLQGHEGAIGHNILRDDARKNEALLAIVSNQTTLAGPFKLVQGGVGIVGRHPITLPVDNNLQQLWSAEHQFWGFASVLIMMDDLLKAVDLNQLNNLGYHYKLWRYDPDSGEKQVFARNAGGEVPELIMQKIVVSNAVWYLNVYPKRNDLFPMFERDYLILLIIFNCFATVIIFTLIRQPKNMAIENDALREEITRLKDNLEQQSVDMKTFQLCCEHANCTVVITDVNGKVYYTNKRFTQDTGYSFDDIYGKTPALLRHPDTPVKIYRSLWGTILKGRIWSGIMRNKDKQGNIYLVDLSIYPVMDSKNKISSFVGISVKKPSN
jgi:PAS domain S-box-containing protein